jgi:hypothetical protein
MQIVIDHHFDTLGNLVGVQFIDTADPVVQAMLTAFKGNSAAQTTAGYLETSNHPSYKGKTRWQVILSEVVRLNDATARGILGV